MLDRGYCAEGIFSLCSSKTKDSSPDIAETTVVIRRPSKIRTDERGRNVLDAPVEDIELELISTGELEVILQEANSDSLDSMAAIAKSEESGVVARCRETGIFTVVTDKELEILRQNEAADLAGSSDEASSSSLSLVSTQMLQVMLKVDDADDDLPDEEASKGFDPYDHS